MTKVNHTLREIKKAKTKLSLYTAALELMQDKMFHEVMLEQICREAEVSKVTFFKFFPQKEDMLVYFMRIWLTKRIIEIEERGLTGFDTVRLLLRAVAEQAEQMPGMMPSLIAFLSQMKMHPRMPELSEAEVELLFPGQEAQGRRSPNMHELFLQAMQEAQQEEQLRPYMVPEDAAKLLFTIFYGGYLTAQQYNARDILGYYELHLRWLEQPQEVEQG